MKMASKVSRFSTKWRMLSPRARGQSTTGADVLPALQIDFPVVIHRCRGKAQLGQLLARQRLPSGQPDDEQAALPRELAHGPQPHQPAGLQDRHAVANQLDFAEQM